MTGPTPGFNIRIRRITHNICGIEAINSQKRIIMLSARPPKYPAMPPYKIPIVPFRIDTTRAIKRLTLAPSQHLTKMSLPRSSVPNKCSPDGPWLTAIKSVLSYV
jgi:hypothetical protein